MGEQKIAEVGPWKVRSDSNALGNPKDDATLMSASKDMLEALEMVMNDWGPEADEAVQAAIKKARGQK